MKLAKRIVSDVGDIAEELEVKRVQMPQDKISLLLPVHNEGGTIQKTILEFYQEIGTKIPIEIIVCEDGSTDGTKEELLELSKQIPIKLVLGDKRKGYLRAVKDGLNIVNSDLVLFADSDGQHVAKDFWKLYEVRGKYPVVSGYRVKRADAPHRRLMSAIFRWMATTLFKLPSFHDMTAPFKLMQTKVAQEISNECKYMKYSFWTEFTVRAYKKGFNLTEVSVDHRRRMNGATRLYNPEKLMSIVLSQLIGLFKLWKELYR
jgi:glycosyltransferase involved in cell wall biosynthesis